MTEPLTAIDNSRITVFDVVRVTADLISVGYDTLPGNNPQEYGNKVFLWQNQNEIPWSQPPLEDHEIIDNSQSGTTEFNDLSVNNNSYIVGYAVGPRVSDICSTAFIPAAGQNAVATLFQTNLRNLEVGSTSLSVEFQTPTGYTPAAHRNWIGLWRGATASYTREPDARSLITIDGNIGTTGLNGLSLGRNLTYTLAYFMGEGLRTMACTLTFTV